MKFFSRLNSLSSLKNRLFKAADKDFTKSTKPLGSFFFIILDFGISKLKTNSFLVNWVFSKNSKAYIPQTIQHLYNLSLPVFTMVPFFLIVFNRIHIRLLPEFIYYNFE